MKDQTSPVDVAVVGAGPIGCIAALSFANRGARVLLLEASREPPRRLAGEWLHPPAAEILARWNVSLPESCASSSARGFVVFPHDGSPPIPLPYASGSSGATCEHGPLVAALRKRVREDPHVRILEGARVTAISGQTLSYVYDGGPENHASASFILGADGRSSTVRRLANMPDRRVAISSMAGILLEDVELPLEGFGHVVLGGPGPALIYRLGPRQVRACLDVPLSLARSPDARSLLWEAYGNVLPPTIGAALRRALEARPIAWASNQFRPRTHFGREGLALAGDAVGHFHPLTAVGLTLGLQDALSVAESASVNAYRRDRSAQSRVAEVLATALYKAFTLQDEETEVVRAAIYNLWREDPLERERTMGLLSAQEADPAEFRRVFRTVLARALDQTVATRSWASAPGILRTLSGMLERPAARERPRSLRESLGLSTFFRRYSGP
jgi:squalene monooxygenase